MYWLVFTRMAANETRHHTVERKPIPLSCILSPVPWSFGLPCPAMPCHAMPCPFRPMPVAVFGSDWPATLPSKSKHRTSQSSYGILRIFPPVVSRVQNNKNDTCSTTAHHITLVFLLLPSTLSPAIQPLPSPAPN